MPVFIRPWQVLYRVICIAHTFHNVCFAIMLAISGKHESSKKNTHNSDLAIRMERAGPALARRSLCVLVVQREGHEEKPLSDWLAVWAQCIETRWGTSIKAAMQYLQHRDVIVNALTIRIRSATLARKEVPSPVKELYDLLSIPKYVLQLLIYQSIASYTVGPFIKWAQKDGGRRAGEVHELLHLVVARLGTAIAVPAQVFARVKGAVGGAGLEGTTWLEAEETIKRSLVVATKYLNKRLDFLLTLPFQCFPLASPRFEVRRECAKELVSIYTRARSHVAAAAAAAQAVGAAATSQYAMPAPCSQDEAAEIITTTDVLGFTSVQEHFHMLKALAFSTDTDEVQEADNFIESLAVSMFAIVQIASSAVEAMIKKCKHGIKPEQYINVDALDAAGDAYCGRHSLPVSEDCSFYTTSRAEARKAYR